MSWHLRSMGDRDTHSAAGLRPDGTVVAECGAQFRPYPLSRGRTALRGDPPDPEQICPDCNRAKDVR